MSKKRSFLSEVDSKNIDFAKVQQNIKEKVDSIKSYKPVKYIQVENTSNNFIKKLIVSKGSKNSPLHTNFVSTANKNIDFAKVQQNIKEKVDSIKSYKPVKYIQVENITNNFIDKLIASKNSKNSSLHTDFVSTTNKNFDSKIKPKTNRFLENDNLLKTKENLSTLHQQRVDNNNLKKPNNITVDNDYPYSQITDSKKQSVVVNAVLGKEQKHIIDNNSFVNNLLTDLIARINIVVSLENNKDLLNLVDLLNLINSQYALLSVEDKKNCDLLIYDIDNIFSKQEILWKYNNDKNTNLDELFFQNEYQSITAIANKAQELSQQLKHNSHAKQEDANSKVEALSINILNEINNGFYNFLLPKTEKLLLHRQFLLNSPLSEQYQQIIAKHSEKILYIVKHIKIIKNIVNETAHNNNLVSSANTLLFNINQELELLNNLYKQSIKNYGSYDVHEIDNNANINLEQDSSKSTIDMQKFIDKKIVDIKSQTTKFLPNSIQKSNNAYIENQEYTVGDNALDDNRIFNKPAIIENKDDDLKDISIDYNQEIINKKSDLMQQVNDKHHKLKQIKNDESFNNLGYKAKDLLRSKTKLHHKNDQVFKNFKNHFNIEAIKEKSRNGHLVADVKSVKEKNYGEYFLKLSEELKAMNNRQETLLEVVKDGINSNNQESMINLMIKIVDKLDYIKDSQQQLQTQIASNNQSSIRSNLNHQDVTVASKIEVSENYNLDNKVKTENIASNDLNPHVNKLLAKFSELLSKNSLELLNVNIFNQNDNYEKIITDLTKYLQGLANNQTTQSESEGNKSQTIIEEIVQSSNSEEVIEHHSSNDNNNAIEENANLELLNVNIFNQNNNYEKKITDLTNHLQDLVNSQTVQMESGGSKSQTVVEEVIQSDNSEEVREYNLSNDDNDNNNVIEEAVNFGESEDSEIGFSQKQVITEDSNIFANTEEEETVVFDKAELLPSINKINSELQNIKLYCQQLCEKIDILEQKDQIVRGDYVEYAHQVVVIKEEIIYKLEEIKNYLLHNVNSDNNEEKFDILLSIKNQQELIFTMLNNMQIDSEINNDNIKQQINNLLGAINNNDEYIQEIFLEIENSKSLYKQYSDEILNEVVEGNEQVDSNITVAKQLDNIINNGEELLRLFNQVNDKFIALFNHNYNNKDFIDQILQFSKFQVEGINQINHKLKDFNQDVLGNKNDKSLNYGNLSSYFAIHNEMLQNIEKLFSIKKQLIDSYYAKNDNFLEYRQKSSFDLNSKNVDMDKIILNSSLKNDFPKEGSYKNIEKLDMLANMEYLKQEINKCLNSKQKD